MAKSVMFLGTGSDVGKSIAATAFCRIFRRRGYKVAPFKAQNMSNNSYVTIEGGEIGRAQVAQAEAAGLLPSIHMNPILLKPSANQGVQVVLQGRPIGTMKAKTYYELKPRFKKAIKESYHYLEKDHDVIIIEGAGSCCEMNLKGNDLVNLPLAKSFRVPCILVADIDRGGVFAQIIGTYQLMTPAERKLAMGFLINKFRGESDLFTSGIDYIEKRTAKPVLGLVPYFQDIHIDSEDSVAVQIDKRPIKTTGPRSVNIAVLRLPTISNFTDLEILEQEEDVIMNYLSHSKDLISDYDYFVLPGTKNVMEDAAWLNRSGWKKAIHEFAGSGKKILGICGGYQLLGRMILDPWGVESDRKKVKGLNLLPITTTLEEEKIVRKVMGACLVYNKPVTGYEIHMGTSRITEKRGESFLKLHVQGKKQAWEDGWSVNQGQIAGTYLHGLFDSPNFRGAILNDLRSIKGLSAKRPQPGRKARFSQYDSLAEHFEKHCDVDKIIHQTMKGI